MGWRFRRSFSILPGIRFNLGKTGTSWTFGRRGFHYTIGKTGTRTTIGIPGTGLSHTTFNKYNASHPASQTHPQSAAQPPPVPTAPGIPPTPMGQPKRNGTPFFIIGGAILGVAVLASIINSGSKSSRPTVQPPVAVSTPVATPSVASTPLSGTSFTPNTIARPVATPAQATATPVMQQQVARAAPVIKEPHPPSDNYVPPFVKVTSTVNVPIMKNGKQVGATVIPAGTQVKLDKINGMTINVTYEGETKRISASSTDLLPRMLGTADD